MSYCTLKEADDYFYYSAFSQSWDDSTNLEKRKALETSTRLIDALPLNILTEADLEDAAYAEYIAQKENNFEIACAEIALAIVDGVNPEKEFDMLNVASQKYANSTVSYNREEFPEHIIYHIPSSLAWQYLKPYVYQAGDVDLYRTS